MLTNHSRKSFFYRLLAPALTALMIGFVTTAGAQEADASIEFSLFKAGFIVGGSGGSGTLNYKGKDYPISIGGVSLGATIGVSKADLAGEVFNLEKVEDIEGTYSGAKAGVALAGGQQVAELKNSKGVVLKVQGKQIGLEVALDLNGMKLSFKEEKAE
jgi:lipid-binding SYLF domain-containing protein